jgi:hypothetical protein
VQSPDVKSALTGDWQGTKQLYMEPPPTPAITSASQASVTSIAGGSFLQLSYTWTFEGEEQSGVLLFGSDEENNATVAWVDSFHMSSKIMFSTGQADGASIDVRGSYQAPPGPDWGWRTQIRSISAGEFQLVMHNISPAGEEDLAVQIDYTRRG